MLSHKRHQRILDFIKRNKSAQVNELSDMLGISVSTVRRDLRELEEDGLINRVHGGAVPIETDNAFESPVLMRASTYALEKTRIGKAAADLVGDNETIIITSGTTTEAMLPYLGEKQNLTVITNAINIAYKLAQFPDIELIVLGGWLRRAEYTLLGHLTTHALQDLQASKVFHGTYGIDPENGLTGTFLPEVQTDRAILGAARELITLADSSKFNQIGPVRTVSVEAITTLVTDNGASGEDLQALRDKGIQVIVV